VYYWPISQANIKKYMKTKNLIGSGSIAKLAMLYLPDHDKPDSFLLSAESLESLSIKFEKFQLKVWKVLAESFWGGISCFSGLVFDFFFARVINNKLYYLKDNKII